MFRPGGWARGCNRAWRRRVGAPSVVHVLKYWAAWPRGIRWLVGAIPVVVLGLAIAWALLVPAADRSGGETGGAARK